jgi:hypothetical protein
LLSQASFKVVIAGVSNFVLGHPLQTPLEELLEEEEKEYRQAVAAGPAIAPGQEPNLNMRVRLVHGDELVADSAEGGLAAACKKYKEWIAKNWPAN